MNYIFVLISGLLAYFAGSSEAIVGGAFSPQNKYPYHVALQVPGLGYNCGGALLNDQHVLTAAHCIIQPTDEFVVGLFILAGTNNFHESAPPAQTVEVSKAYVLKEYRPLSHRRLADIAVLKLKNKLRMDIHERPLAKVHLPNDHHDDYIDKNGTITGFGWDWIGPDGNGGHMHTQLRHSEAAVLSITRCASAGPPVLLSSEHLCATLAQTTNNGTHGVCVHDGGGPLVFQGTVIGILTINPDDCSERIIPGVYTRVTAYLEFIHYAIHDKKHDDIRVHDFHAGSLS